MLCRGVSSGRVEGGTWAAGRECFSESVRDILRRRQAAEEGRGFFFGGLFLQVEREESRRGFRLER